MEVSEVEAIVLDLVDSLAAIMTRTTLEFKNDDHGIRDEYGVDALATAGYGIFEENVPTGFVAMSRSGCSAHLFKISSSSSHASV